MANRTTEKRLRKHEHECECRSFEYYDVDEVDAEIERLNEALMRAHGHWPCPEHDSSSPDVPASQEQAMSELAEQAQKLDMGY